MHQSSLKHCDRILGLSKHFRQRRTAFFRGTTRSDKGQRLARNVCDRFSIKPRLSSHHPPLGHAESARAICGPISPCSVRGTATTRQRGSRPSNHKTVCVDHFGATLFEGIPRRNSSRSRRFARDVNARHIKVVIPKYFETYCVE